MSAEREQSRKLFPETRDGKIVVTSEMLENNPSLARGIMMDPDSFVPQVTVAIRKPTPEEMAIAEAQLRPLRKRLGIVDPEEPVVEEHKKRRFLGKFRK